MSQETDVLLKNRKRLINQWKLQADIGCIGREHENQYVEILQGIELELSKLGIEVSEPTLSRTEALKWLIAKAGQTDDGDDIVIVSSK